MCLGAPAHPNYQPPFKDLTSRRSHRLECVPVPIKATNAMKDMKAMKAMFATMKALSNTVNLVKNLIMKGMKDMKVKPFPMLVPMTTMSAIQLDAS